MKRQYIHQRIIVGGNLAASMVGRKTFGDKVGISSFVEFADIEADRAGLDRLPRMFGHQGDDAATVDPAGQECAQRHIGDHPRCYALAHQPEQLLFQLGLTALRAFAEVYVPIFDRLRQ